MLNKTALRCRWALVFCEAPARDTHCEVSVYDRDSSVVFASQVGPSLEVLDLLGAKDAHQIREGEWWRFFTPMFLHAGIIHLVLNMVRTRIRMRCSLSSQSARFMSPLDLGEMAAAATFSHPFRTEPTFYHQEGTPHFGGKLGGVSFLDIHVAEFGTGVFWMCFWTYRGEKSPYQRFQVTTPRYGTF